MGQTERALGIEMRRRESSYHGGDYYRFSRGSVDLRLQSNVDFYEGPDGQGLAEPEFPHAAHLLLLDMAQDAPEMVAALDADPDVFEKLRSR